MLEQGMFLSMDSRIFTVLFLWLLVSFAYQTLSSLLVCPGITLVMSPLVSLIQYQIMHLLQANIPAAYLSADMEWTEQQEIVRELCSDYCKYKLCLPGPDDMLVLDTAYMIYVKFEEYPNALQTALFLDNMIGDEKSYEILCKAFDCEAEAIFELRQKIASATSAITSVFGQ